MERSQICIEIGDDIDGGVYSLLQEKMMDNVNTTHEDFDCFVDEFIHEKYLRTVIIIATSKIDESLQSILEKYFILGDEKTKIFDPDKPLSTLSSKIVIAYRLALISINMFNLLTCIRKIRNICAHDVRVDFTSSPLRDHYRTIKNSVVKHKSYELVKERYFYSKLNNIEEAKCIYLTVCCLLEAIRLEVIQKAISNELTDIF
jgi:hypothetical protein